eukprot:CAMPEP_0183787790 /NCGR_PEP_ID=MMETSP0739-20130205/67723_1 /TAXON_ID=385413 /ORGANISM="Thalassiosira miniscula, Strain CCMP1093" /LENGTH=512 /DNA_ID=CAMNT_0026031883 /DNA_START=49 /DNA_END=1587 /DNA_ORIENTATION=-
MNINVPAVAPAPAAQAATSMCPLCCEAEVVADDASSVKLTSCKHQSCKSCMVKWIEREESSGQTNATPTCPFCRSSICDEDVIAILGRPFEPKQATANNGPNASDDEIDDLTLHWMNENTVPCGVCGYRIEKESGCDKMECLCGYRFCYSCGVAGAVCDCNPGHDFDADYVAGEEPIRDVDGNVDLRSCINRRNVRRERENKKEERENEESRRWSSSETAAAVCTVNGRWLFSSKNNDGCIKMLEQQLWARKSGVRFERGRKREESESEVIIRWASSEKAAAVCTVNGRWLFSSKNYDGCIEMLKQQLCARKRDQDEVTMRRRIRRFGRRDSNEVNIINASWIFLPKGSEIKALKQILAGPSVRSRRSIKKHIRADEEERSALEVRLNIAWLFVPNHVGIKILTWTKDALRKHEKRSQAKDGEDSEDISSLDIFIRSGAWLYHTAKPLQTTSNLVRLVKHSEERGEKRFSKMLDELFSGSCGADCPNCGGKKSEERLLESIQFVFPLTDGDD